MDAPSLNCRNNGTDPSLLFWKFNETVRDTWEVVLKGTEYNLTDAQVENVFNASMKSEPAEEYWE